MLEAMSSQCAIVASNTAPVQELREKAARETITFVYAAKDEEHNGALALKEFLEAVDRGTIGEHLEPIEPLCR